VPLEQQQQRRPAPDEEPHIYVFAGQGRRGADSLVPRRPRLTRLQQGEAVRECRRRWYRTRTGRYVLEFEVERLGDRLDRSVPEKLWINQDDYEELWRQGRMHGDPTGELDEGTHAEDGRYGRDASDSAGVADDAALR
jgi:hypothetical protein